MVAFLEQYSRLPVCTVVQLRDLRRVGIKLKYVLIPRQGNQEDTLRELKNCAYGAAYHALECVCRVESCACPHVVRPATLAVDRGPLGPSHAVPAAVHVSGGAAVACRGSLCIARAHVGCIHWLVCPPPLRAD